MKISLKFKALIFAALAAGLLFYTNKKTYSPKGISIDKKEFPITGIDISNHSGKVNFKDLKKENLDFVFLKATEGNSFKDKSFEKYYENAIENDFVVGFYHFYRFDKDPIEQATFFLKQVKSKKHQLPLVIDVEEWGNKIVKPKSEIIDDIEVFINHIEKEMNLKVMIYTNESGFKAYVKNRFKENLVWICSFKKGKKIEGKWKFWQHSHKGKFKSVQGWVDINTFNGSRVEWNAFLKEIKI
ncbi:glycoside hydrolase family 25 protein [Aureivirga marina]|uniref:glycoside hydrolase family 25 protein n=1 Tax=Aureivirga marina TaxID=1182451 RepID=UPI0018CAB20A|nr:GH25 family lysozyme [Aureivirga marina]